MAVGFTFHQSKCTGCQACILACTIENGLAFDTSWRTVYTYNDRHYPHLSVQHLSLACNHCEEPACLSACPASAYSIKSETGIVQLDETKCIGCRYCTWACPFGAPRFDETRGVIGKCTFCIERQEADRAPACVELCPTGALGVDVRQSTRSKQVVAGFPTSNLGPAITVTPATANRTALDVTTPKAEAPFVPTRSHPGMRSALRDEWPLAVFTFLLPIIVGVLSTSMFTLRPPSLVTFLGISSLAASLSTVHLGKKNRAWRAVLNPTSSWLSREVLLFGALIGLGAVYLGLVPNNRLVGWLALAIGFATLISVDRVYSTLPLIDARRYHSASALLTGLFLIGVLSVNPLVAGSFGVGKLALYVHRKVEFMKLRKPVRPVLSGVRLAVGFVAPGIFWALRGYEANVAMLGMVLLGELIDRLEFYVELDIVTPEKQMTLDLHKAISS